MQRFVTVDRRKPLATALLFEGTNPLQHTAFMVLPAEEHRNDLNDAPVLIDIEIDDRAVLGDEAARIPPTTGRVNFTMFGKRPTRGAFRKGSHR